MVQVQELTADYTGILSDNQIEQFLRYDGTDQSDILPLLIESASRQAEDYCNATFGNKTFSALFSEASCDKGYYLPFSPIREVTEVTLIASDGSESVITSGFNVFGLTQKWIEFSSDGMYKVTYSAGTATPANQKATIKEAILTILSENFENRTEVLIGASVTPLPRNSKILLAPFRNNIM